MGQDLVPQAALPLAGGFKTVRIASDECSAALWRRLTESDATREAISHIGRSAALKAEVIQVAPRLAAWAAPIDPIVLTRRLTEIGLLFYLEDRSDEEWATFWTFYRDALRTLPEAAFEHAIVVWNQEGKGFMPKPAEIYERAKAMALQLGTAAMRARKAAEWVERLPPPKSEKLTKAEMIERGWLDANGKVIMAPLKGIPPSRPAPGETPQEMAARLRNQAAAPPPADEDPGEAI